MNLGLCMISKKSMDTLIIDSCVAEHVGVFWLNARHVYWTNEGKPEERLHIVPRGKPPISKDASCCCFFGLKSRAFKVVNSLENQSNTVVVVFN